MFGSEVLEVGIGMTLLFLFASLLVTGLREFVETSMQSRAGDLERGIRELLNDPTGKGLATTFYEHPIIYALFRGKYDAGKLVQKAPDEYVMSREGCQPLPAYIPAGHFATALLDIAARGSTSAGRPVGQPGPPMSLDSLRDGAALIQDDRVRCALLAAMDGAGDDISRIKANLEDWYDGTMDRVSGWYRKRTQYIVFGLGLLVAVVLNIDALTVYSRLSNDKTLRSVIVDQASSSAGTVSPSMDIETVRKNLDAIGFPIGWPPPQLRKCELSQPGKTGQACDPPYFEAGWWLMPAMVGWLITAFAVTLGAPFWFDVLNKIMVIRSTVKPKEKSGEEGSEDRAGPRRAEGAGTTGQIATPAASAEDASAAEQAAAETVTRIALASNAFERHEWADGQPDRGLA